MKDNEIPHCGLELGCCPRQISYDLSAHDRMVHDEGYQQGRADAIKEIRIKVLELYKSCRSWWKFYNTLINDILEVEEEQEELKEDKNE